MDNIGSRSCGWLGQRKSRLFGLRYQIFELFLAFRPPLTVFQNTLLSRSQHDIVILCVFSFSCLIGWLARLKCSSLGRYFYNGNRRSSGNCHPWKWSAQALSNMGPSHHILNMYEQCLGGVQDGLRDENVKI